MDGIHVHISQNSNRVNGDSSTTKSSPYYSSFQHEQSSRASPVSVDTLSRLHPLSLAMDDLPIEKITIPGPTLASMIQRFSSSPSDVDGLLFGHVTQPTPSNLLDDDDPSTHSTSPSLHANITSHFCSGTISSFYDSLGQLTAPSLTRILKSQQQSANNNRSLLGWFVGRRKTPLRPSMREFLVSKSLIQTLTLTLNPNSSPNFLPCLFIILSIPSPDQPIHTHEYRAFQFRNGRFEPKTVDVINIGPAFRVHYGQFSPNSGLPWLACETPAKASTSREVEMGEDKSLSASRRVAKDQKLLDMCADGFEIGRLSKLMGSEASHYTSELEDLYGKMLGKLEGLANLVEKTSTKVLEQEHRNMKSRRKFAGLE